MKFFAALLFAFAALGCDGLVRDAGLEAKKQCKAVLDEELPKLEEDVANKAWAECSDYFENEAIPKIRMELEMSFEQQVEKQLLLFGCTKDNFDRWDCRQTTLCQGR